MDFRVIFLSMLTLVLLSAGLNVLVMWRTADWSWLYAVRFWYGHPLWLEHIIEKRAPQYGWRVAGILLFTTLMLLIAFMIRSYQTFTFY